MIVAAFNFVEGGKGEAESSGVLQLGDEVCSVNGVDARGIGLDEVVQLVIAAPRPFVRGLGRSRVLPIIYAPSTHCLTRCLLATGHGFLSPLDRSRSISVPIHVAAASTS